jgi:hypothetical protein
MPEPESIDQEPDDHEEDGKLVEFPADAFRMPEPLLPRPVGRIASGHPLKRPLAIALVIFVLILAADFVVTLFHAAHSSADRGNRGAYSNTFRDPGAITYGNQHLNGWFLDPQHEHFQSEDGRRFTHVDSHEREGSEVTGHWRIIQ